MYIQYVQYVFIDQFSIAERDYSLVKTTDLNVKVL